MEKNICIAGFGGQGVMTLGKFLSEAVCYSTEQKVTFFPSYGAEQRGGTANCYVVISDKDIGTPVADFMDFLIVMNEPSLSKFLPKLKTGGTLFVNSSIVTSEIERNDIKIVYAPMTELALDVGNAKVINIVTLGVFIGYTEAAPTDIVWNTIEAKFKKKPKLLQLNQEAYNKGLELGRSQR